MPSEPEAMEETGRNAAEPELDWRERIRHFTWTWFTMTMATGGIASVLDKVSPRFKGLYTIGVVFTIINIVLFLFCCTMMALRAYLWPRNFKASFFHPTESLFIPAIFVSIAVIIMNICEYGLSGTKTGPWLEHAAVVLYWLYLALSFAASAGIYLLMWSTQTFTVASMTPQWILPAYPLLLVGPMAGVLSRPNLKISPNKALQIIVGGTMAQGAGFCLALMIYSAYLYRLMTQKLPPDGMRPSMFVSVGPSAFTVSALINMAYNFPSATPSVFMGIDGQIAGHIVKVFGIWTGVWLYGLAVWFLIVSIGAHWSCIRSSKLQFAMTWNAYIFPNSAFVSATFAIARGLGGVFAIQIVGCVLMCILIAVWLVVMTLMVRAVVRKQLLWPQKQEDRDEDTESSDLLGQQLRDGGIVSPSIQSCDVEEQRRLSRIQSRLSRLSKHSSP